MVIRQCNKTSIQVAEIKSILSVKGRTKRDQLRKDVVREGLGTFSLDERVNVYSKRWDNYVLRRHQLSNIHFSTRRSLGCPMERCVVEPEQVVID